MIETISIEDVHEIRGGRLVASLAGCGDISTLRTDGECKTCGHRWRFRRDHAWKPETEAKG